MSDRDRSFETRDFGWLFALSCVFFILVAVTLWREYRTEWRPEQEQFQQILVRHGKLTAASRFKVGIQQIWVPRIGVVDRCITCHVGYDWGSVLPADTPEPLTPHPAISYLAKHDFGRFGCTTCHGGQGWAVTAAAAHGPTKDWESPMLSRRLARSYGLKESELMQMRCNSCHRRDVSTPGMDDINRAKILFKKKKCRLCHVVQGHGGLTGPELTYFGDKNPELFDFSHVTGPHTVFNWSVQHLIEAGKISPHTAMPDYHMSPADAKALTMMLLSWKRESYPPDYIPGPVIEKPIRGVRKIIEPPEVPGQSAGRAVFRDRGCTSCHTVGAGELIGPDLKGVGQRRLPDWLRTWLADPAAVIRAHPDLATWPDQYYGIIMPNQNLSPKEIEALVAYLGKL